MWLDWLGPSFTVLLILSLSVLHRIEQRKEEHRTRNRARLLGAVLTRKRKFESTP